MPHPWFDWTYATNVWRAHDVCFPHIGNSIFLHRNITPMGKVEEIPFCKRYKQNQPKILFFTCIVRPRPTVVWLLWSMNSSSCLYCCLDFYSLFVHLKEWSRSFANRRKILFNLSGLVPTVACVFHPWAGLINPNASNSDAISLSWALFPHAQNTYCIAQKYAYFYRILLCGTVNTKCLMSTHRTRS